MMEDYLNDYIKLKRNQGYDFNGKTKYNPEEQIKVRVNFETRLVRNKVGKEVTSQATIYAVNEIKVDDAVIIKDKEWPVITVKEIKDLDGNIEAYTATI